MAETTVDVLRRHRATCPVQNCEWCAELDGVIANVAELIEAATAHASSCETSTGELRAPSLAVHVRLLQAIDHAAIGGASHG